MADTRKFNNLATDRRRFSSELLAELRREIPSLLATGNQHAREVFKELPGDLYDPA